MAKQCEQGSQRVLVPPSRHITTSFHSLIDDLSAGPTRGSQEDYEAVAEILDSIALHDFQTVRRRLKQNFKPFADAAAGNRLGQHCSAGKFDDLEVGFLDDLCALLQAAHFKVLTNDEWQMACDNDFTFTNPLEVAWENMDQQLLRRFWKRRESAFINAAAISESVLVMHRGVHLSRAKGMFLEDKIDLLVLYLVASPFEHLFRPMMERLVKALQGNWNRVWPKISVVDSVKDNGLYRSSKETKHTTVLQHQPHTKDPLLEHENAKWVQRVTLKDVMPTASAVFKHLFKEVTIQEPTFRDVLILYRRKSHSQAQKKDEKAPLKDAKPEDLQRNINIKRFQDVPIADLEMIFPDKKVYLKPLLLIQLMITIVIGLASVIVTVLTTEASWSLIGAVLSIIGTRAFQVWSSAQLGRQNVLDQITERLYEQTMDAQDGVMYFLLDQMADQHVKELMLAYFLMLRLGKPVTAKELDERCEEYLKEHFGEAVDFALEKSLPVLIEDGLITRDAEGQLTPAPIEEGRRVLAAKGQAYFSSAKSKRSKLPLFSQMSSKQIRQAKAGQAEKGSNSAGSNESPELGDHKEQPIMQPVPQKEGTAASPWNSSPAAEEIRQERKSRVGKSLKSIFTSSTSEKKHT